LKYPYKTKENTCSWQCIKTRGPNIAMKIPRYARPELLSLNEALVPEASVHFYVGSGSGGGRGKCRNRDDG